MSRIAAFARLTAAPGKRDELVAAIEAELPAVEADTGTHLYILHADKRDPDVIQFYELYESKEALVQHGEWAKEVLADLGSLLAGPPEVVLAEPLAGKGLP